MSGKERLIYTKEDLIPAIDGLIKSIRKSSSSYDTSTNPLVKEIHQAWEAVREGRAEKALRQSLRSLDTFAEAIYPQDMGIRIDKFKHVLDRKIGIYMQSEMNDSGIVVVYKQPGINNPHDPSQERGWRRTYRDDWKDEYTREAIIEEADNMTGFDYFGNGFHATTSAALENIGKRKALVSSAILKHTGGIVSGEVSGTGISRRHIYVHIEKIVDSYGWPRWFDQFTIVFGISMSKQKEYLEKIGKDMGIFSPSDGMEIGEEVPLENIQIVSSNYVHLGKIKGWIRRNCPKATAISREALRIITGK